jgi:hypothetical protein
MMLGTDEGIAVGVIDGVAVGVSMISGGHTPQVKSNCRTLG